MMKNLLFLALILLLGSCGMQQIDSSIAIYTPNKVHLNVVYFHDGIGKATSSAATPLSPEIFPTTYYLKNGKTPTRPFIYEVCRIDNNPLDTIKIFYEGDELPQKKYSIANYDECSTDEIFRNELQNKGKNFPSINEFMAFVKVNFSDSYYEILPSQQCLMIE